MTNSLIPYSFTPGTKAKAQEVNANFNALADKIDENNSTAVHANTESEISGKKTFTQPIYSTVKQTATNGNIIITNIGDGDSTDAILAKNTSDVRCGALRFTNEDGANEVQIVAANEDGSNVGGIAIRNTDGVCYAACPTYTQDYADNSNKIVTTAYMANHWVTAKATTSTSASKARPAVVVENYVNGTSWYRIWSDGWIQQGGLANKTVDGWSQTSAYFLKNFSNINYCMYAMVRGGTNVNAAHYKIYARYTDHFIAQLAGASSSHGDVYGFFWRAEGY